MKDPGTSLCHRGCVPCGTVLYQGCIQKGHVGSSHTCMLAECECTHTHKHTHTHTHTRMHARARTHTHVHIPMPGCSNHGPSGRNAPKNFAAASVYCPAKKADPCKQQHPHGLVLQARDGHLPSYPHRSPAATTGLGYTTGPILGRCEFTGVSWPKPSSVALLIHLQGLMRMVLSSAAQSHFTRQPNPPHLIRTL